MKRIGYGGGYRYVHSDPSAKEEMACLPERLRDRVYYDEEQDTEHGTQNTEEHC
jgi:putative ATPase